MPWRRLATEAARSDGAFRRAYEVELRKSLKGICYGNQGGSVPEGQQLEDAIAFMALCIGGISLARAVEDGPFSEQILQACIAAADRLATDLPKPH